MTAALNAVIGFTYTTYRGVTIERVKDGFNVLDDHFETLEEAKACVDQSLKSFGKNFIS